jgi:hypothetical protein
VDFRALTRLLTLPEPALPHNVAALVLAVVILANARPGPTAPEAAPWTVPYDHASFVGGATPMDPAAIREPNLAGTAATPIVLPPFE